MFNISDFFSRVKSVHTRDTLLKQSVIEVVKNQTGLLLNNESIQVNSTIITIYPISPVEKSQLYIKKQAIIEELNIIQKIRNITDIK